MSIVPMCIAIIYNNIHIQCIDSLLLLHTILIEPPLTHCVELCGNAYAPNQYLGHTIGTYKCLYSSSISSVIKLQSDHIYACRLSHALEMIIFVLFILNYSNY